jgi:hypothetical protein
MNKILKEVTIKTADGQKQTYVTVKFTGHHQTFQEVEAIRVFRLPSNQPRDEFLHQEYDRWFHSFDTIAEF